MHLKKLGFFFFEAEITSDIETIKMLKSDFSRSGRSFFGNEKLQERGLDVVIPI